MQLTSLLRSAATMAVLSVLSLLLFQTAQAETETDLYNFCSVGGANCLDGEYPIGPLVVGADGTFFATSDSGGTSGSGTVLGLFPEPSGGCGTGSNTGNGWCEFVLYNFCSVANCADGNTPLGGVSYLNGHLRTPGNLYGTTYSGGSHNAGTVFEIFSEPIPSGCPSGSNTSGGWCERVLYNFCSYNIGESCSDGYHPAGNLVEDSAGNLYGTVVGEANNGVGGVFELSPDQQGGYDEALIYSDDFVIGGLAIDSADNLYGVDLDGILGVANIFKISLSQPGAPTVDIYTFTATSKYGLPIAGPAVDSAGNVYGTTFGTTGGDSLPGSLWKLTPVTGGVTYKYKVLHSFAAKNKTGQNPGGGVLLDSSGNIYSTTTYGGSPDCQAGPGCGTIFELVASGDTYKYKLLWKFNGTDGAAPSASPILNSAGDLYGVTAIGEANNLGAMFEVKP